MNNIKGLSEKKRGEVASMESLRAVASLLQQIDSYMDDSNHEIMSVAVYSTDLSIQIGKDTFFASFSQFEIKVSEGLKYPYRLTKSIEGVEFVTYCEASHIVNLKESDPAQWKYIQKKLQVDVP